MTQSEIESRLDDIEKRLRRTEALTMGRWTYEKGKMKIYWHDRPKELAAEINDLDDGNFERAMRG